MSNERNWTPSRWAVVGDRYEVRERVGAGGIVRVWRAHDRRADRDVALKHVRFEGENYRHAPEKVHRLFRNGIDVLRQVREAGGHPNIVDLYDVVSERGTGFAAVELVEGRELDGEAVSLSESEAREVTMQLADAMGFLHRNEIIFRDLKPDNVIVRPDGSPVLVDFNTAKGLDDGLEPQPTCPDCGLAVGAEEVVCPSCERRLDGSADTQIGGRTEVWKPPESVEDRAQLRQGPWSDVYSLGKVFLMLLLGPDTPVPAVDGRGPRRFGVDCEPHNDEIIERATAANYDRRYNNARVLRTVLEARDPDPPAQAVLVHEETGEEYTISPGDTIGRTGADGPAATITVDDPQGSHISAVQLQFDRDDDGDWRLVDRSLNGTYVQLGSGWERVLCERGRQRLRRSGHDPTNRHGNVPPETLRLSDGALIALVDPEYGVTFRFEEVV